MTKIVVAILIAFAWLDGHAQATLPPCSSDMSAYRTNCVGTFTYHYGTQYVGGWKDNGRYGQGSLISPKGYTLVEGFWDDATVIVNDLQWKWIAESSNANVFVLSESTKQVGAFRRAWVMWAVAEPDAAWRYRSFRQLQNFDCMNERAQVLSSTEHSGSFGSGDLLRSGGEEKWDYIAPSTLNAHVMKYVCNHKL